MGFWGDIIRPVAENGMEKKMQNELDSGIILGFVGVRVSKI